MGGATSHEDGVHFEHREEYSRWSLDNITAAYERFRAMKERYPGDSPFLCNRREWWEVREHSLGGSAPCRTHEYWSHWLHQNRLANRNRPPSSTFLMPHLPHTRTTQVFTDYSTVKNGAFLSLPMTHFDAFAQDHPLKVFVYEVFAVMTLFCAAAPEDKIRFGFDIFDFNKNGYLTRVRLLRCPRCGCSHICDTRSVPAHSYLAIFPLSAVVWWPSRAS